MSGTGIADTDFVKEVLYECSGYQMVWKLAYLAKHPRLVDSPTDLSMPIQRGFDTFLDYRAAWQHYLHVYYIRGVFLSDRYFTECFLRNMHSAYNSSLKPLMFHLVRRIHANDPLPSFFSPENFPSYICHSSTNIGIRGLNPMMTPKEFAALHKPRSNGNGSNKTSTASTSTIRSLDTAPAYVDICQMDILDDDALLAVCSLMAANPCSCDYCGATDHLVAQCPKLRSLAQEPSRVNRLLKALEAARLSRGGSFPSRPSPPTRPSTLPTSNRSGLALVRQLHEDDTDEDVSISRLTDDEGLASDVDPDFA